MSDPLPDALRVLPRLYLLTADGLGPISIRDQMVRAQMLITRALGQKEITPSDKVLVVGAGAAGAVAAMTCASFGIDTTIVDKNARPFSRQAACTTRWVDPLQYDWPADRWSSGVSYPSHSPVPLPWRADLSFRIARSWNRAFSLARGRYLTFYPWTRVTHINPVGGMPPTELDVFFKGPIRSPSRYKAVIWAAGFGEEICTMVEKRHGTGVIQHIGPAFWSPDALESRGCGSPDPNPKVVILGGGDGGVQDLLRALTKCKSARDAVFSLPIDPSILSELYNAEEWAHRYWIWAGSNPRHDHALYEKLDNIHRHAAKQALTKQALKDEIERLLGLDENPDSLEDVRLFHRCNHLTCFYGLNRFLAHLLDLYLQTEPPPNRRRRLLIPNRTVIGVDKSRTPWVLDTVDHIACYDPVNIHLPTQPEEAHVVVVRFGLDISSVIPPLPAPVFPLPTPIKLQRPRHSIPVNPVP